MTAVVKGGQAGESAYFIGVSHLHRRTTSRLRCHVVAARLIPPCAGESKQEVSSSVLPAP